MKVGNTEFSDEAVRVIREQSIEESVLQFPHIRVEILKLVKGESKPKKKK